MIKAKTGFAFLIAASLILSGTAIGQAPPKLTAKQKKERIKALPDEEQKWLSDYVAPIILPEEENLFLQLEQPYQREMFKAEFWKRRELPNLPAPFGPGYQIRYEHLRDVAATDYDGLNSDAGRMVVRQGEPAGIEDMSSCGGFRQPEVWSYLSTTGSSNTVRHLFYRPSFGGPRRLWLPGDQGILENNVNPGTSSIGFSSSGFDQLCAISRSSGSCSCALARIAQEISGRGSMEVLAMGIAPKVSTEGLDNLWQRLASSTDPNAKKIALENTADTASTPATGAPASPAPPAKPAPVLSKSEQIKTLPEDERKWLTEYVAPIILPEEEKLFLELTQPHQREIFKTEFWARREKPNMPVPYGPGYKIRYEELRRLADEKYDGWKQDAGRLVLRYGEPASIFETTGCEEVFRGVEIWTYAGLHQSGIGRARYLFYRPSPSAPRKLWRMGIRDDDVFTPNSCRKQFDDLKLDCGTNSLADKCHPPVCGRVCDVYEAYLEIKLRQNNPAGAAIDEANLFKPDESISTEGLDHIKTMMASVPEPGAKKLGVEGPGSAPGAAPAGAQQASAKPSTPAPTRRKLSPKEVKDLTAQLEAKYKQWIQLVDMIITDDERQVFLQIGDNYQKDKFIEAFWKRRSIDSQGLRTDFQRVYTQRIEVAQEQFKNLHNDRAKVFVINGPPDAIIPIDCQDIYVPVQIWFYERLESLKSKVYLVFYQPYGVGEYKLWLPMDGQGVLQVGGNSSAVGRMPGRNVDYTRCAEWRTLQQALAYSTAVLGSGPMAMVGASKLFQPPIVETEGVDQILTMTTELAAGSVPLGVVKLVRFPELRSNKIGVDLSLLVPKGDLRPRELGEEKFYNVDVIGEVVKGDRLIDNFKYRFDIPTTEVNAEKIPLTVRRYLYPGDYNLILKVSDGNQSAEGRITDKLTVPEQPDPPSPAELAARTAGRATVDKARDSGLLPSAITLLPVAKEIVTGLQRFETKVSAGIKAVDFYLNGSKMMTKTRAPFDADLNLGPLPRKQVIRVVAYGETGRAVGEDEYIVNEGKEVFRVRILSPEKGAKAGGPTKVVAAVAVPEGKTLQKLEFYSNESRVATLYQAPYEQTVNIKSTGSLGYVRIVGTLDDGSLAEDLRYVNAPSYISEVSVDAVELYTTVSDKGRPVSGLLASNFKVFEDGAIQKIESFEYVKNLPLAIGVMVDTSASMLESLPEAEQAAMGFLDYSIGPKDRAFTVSFDNEPYLLTKLTNRKDKLFRSFAGMRAEGSTALYDAVVYGLYQFTGVKGKKALVILTDGKDTASKFDFETALDYVRRSGIAVYGIGLKISGSDLDVKYKLNKLAQVSGGQTFYIDSAKNLDAIYHQINEELRSQYLLTYYSTNPAGKDKWRKVEVKVEPTTLQARTLSGYYP